MLRQEDAEKALKILKANGEDAYIMGEIIASEEGVVIVYETRIAVFVSGGGTNLQALIDAAKRGEIAQRRNRIGAGEQ